LLASAEAWEEVTFPQGAPVPVAYSASLQTA